MATVSQDFLRFLAANYPDDYRRASVNDVPEDVITAIMSRHDRHYEIWKEVPEWVKSRYADRLPKEVLNGNELPRTLVEKETEKAKKEEELYDYAADAFALTMLAAGYAAYTVDALKRNKALRQEILAKAKGGKVSGDQLALWLLTRQKDLNLIKEDWEERQPEKYLVHLIKSINRESRRQDRAGDGFDMAASELKINELKEQLSAYLGRLGDDATKQKMVDYLTERPQQMALKHLKPEVLQEFIGMMRGCGIKIEPVENQFEKGLTMNVESVAASFRDNFLNMMKQESLMADMGTREKQSNLRFIQHAERNKKEAKPKSRRVGKGRTQELNS